MTREKYLALSAERLLRQEFGDQPWLRKASEIAVHEAIDALRYNPAWLPGMGIGYYEPTTDRAGQESHEAKVTILAGADVVAANRAANTTTVEGSREQVRYPNNDR